MTRARLLALAAMLLLVGFVAGAWTSWTTSPRVAPARAEAQPLYWICPMHPAYKTDKPGTAPCCGMALEPVYADGAGRPRTAGAIHVDAGTRQLIGVRVGPPEMRGVDRSVRTVGRVVADENREYRLVAAGEGIVRQFPDTAATGSIVRENQLLMTYLARDYVRPQQLYFSTLDNLDAAVKGGAAADRLAQPKSQVRVAIDELLNFGMSEAQIAELGKTRKITSDIEVRSPASGYVVSRSVSPGQRFDRGVELFRVADIRRVWIVVDAFESDGIALSPGAPVRITLPNSSRTMEARVSAALPQFDADSRTLKVRLEADNPDFSLRPGMFVDAEIAVTRPAALTIPVEAVVDSGRRKTVFVDRGDGYFEPRAVRTGWRADGRVEIVSGLAASERLALSGTFLLDSETRIKAAAEGIATAAKDPVCGMDVDEGKATRAGLTSTYRGETHVFCSPTCKASFDKNPGAYVSATPATDVAPAKVVDPVCGMNVDANEATVHGNKAAYGGATWYFCSRECKDRFALSPEKFAAPRAAAAK